MVEYMGRNRVYIRPEDVAEFIYETSKNCKTVDEIQKQMRRIISYLKEEKFDKLRSEFGVEL